MRPTLGLTRDQWQALYEFLSTKLKLDVRLIEPVAALPDMVFTADAGLARDEKFVSSNFRNKERRGENQYYEAWFRERGYSIYNLPPGRCCEGDILFAGEADAYAGRLIRSEVDSHAMVANLLAVRIVSLELVDPTSRPMAVRRT